MRPAPPAGSLIASALPSRAMWRTLAAAAALTVLSACSSGSTDPGASATAVGDAVAGPPEIPVIPDWCVPADPVDVDTITRALAGTGNQITDAYTSTDTNGYRYVMADIRSAAGDRLSSADVWVIDPTPGPLGATYAASSSAGEYSILPDAGNIPDATPFDPEIQQLAGCTFASSQQNLG